MRSLKLVVAVLALATGAPAMAQEKPKFVMTDGYFQVDGDRPFHLVHGTPAEQKISFGDGYKFWVGFKLAEGETSPCTSRDQQPCYFESRLALPGVEKEKINDWTSVDFRYSKNPSGEPLMWNVGSPVTRQATLGHRVLYVRLRYGTTVQYLFEVPIEVVE